MGSNGTVCDLLPNDEKSSVLKKLVRTLDDCFRVGGVIMNVGWSTQ